MQKFIDRLGPPSRPSTRGEGAPHELSPLGETGKGVSWLRNINI